MAEQKAVEKVSAQPPVSLLPHWPTSMPGPQVTPPPLGTRRLHVRTEQVVEVNYDPEQGKSSAREA